MEYVGHSDGINSMNCSMDGERMITASKDKTVRICNMKSGECEKNSELQETQPL